MGDDQDGMELPRPTPELIGLGALILALDRRFPGLAEEVKEIVDGEFVKSRHVISIRPPKDWPERQRSLGTLSGWLDRISLAADAYAGWRKRRKRA